MLHVISARYLSHYTINLSFSDGRQGEADLSAIVNNGVFTSLKDIDLFSKFSVDVELDTVVWSNGLDLAPEFLYYAAFKDDPTLRSQFQTWGYIS